MRHTLAGDPGITAKTRKQRTKKASAPLKNRAAWPEKPAIIMQRKAFRQPIDPG
jgi:hypothetical protein